MPPLLATLKRKASSLPNNHDSDASDSDCIAIIPRAARPDTSLRSPRVTTAQRSPFDEVSPNKRQRALDCVWIPKATPRPWSSAIHGREKPQSGSVEVDEDSIIFEAAEEPAAPLQRKRLSTSKPVQSSLNIFLGLSAIQLPADVRGLGKSTTQPKPKKPQQTKAATNIKSSSSPADSARDVLAEYAPTSSAANARANKAESRKSTQTKAAKKPNQSCSPADSVKDDEDILELRAIEEHANKAAASTDRNHPPDRGAVRYDAERKVAASRRPRRSAVRQSYMTGMELDDSGDDLAEMPLPKRRPKAKRKGATDEDDDFDAVEHESSAEEDEGAEDDKSEEESASEAGAESDDVDPEPVRPVKGKARRATSKTAADNSAVDPSDGDKKSKANSGMLNLKSSAGKLKGLDLSLPPLFNTVEIFKDMTEKALNLGLGKATAKLAGRPLRVATMCSGTESPLLALQMVQGTLTELGLRSIRVEHAFSAEIVPFKQAYIERNFAPPIIFRDITEFTKAFKDDVPMATTAYGARVPIPPADIVVAGTSCVDYSRKNAHRKTIDEDGESAKTWYGALSYCKAIRPAIIIFENVQSADWASMLEHYRAIDYDCEGVFVDSKNYYIPHTRERG
ncbi:hypothetical protein LTR53_012572, partial [Teratosphaeriaceae sp. CCFEE 6253]